MQLPAVYPDDSITQATNGTVLVRHQVPMSVSTCIIVFAGTGYRHIWRSLVDTLPTEMIACGQTAVRVGQSNAQPSASRDLRLIPVSDDGLRTGQPTCRRSGAARELDDWAECGQWSGATVTGLACTQRSHHYIAAIAPAYPCVASGALLGRCASRPGRRDGSTPQERRRLGDLAAARSGARGDFQTVRAELGPTTCSFWPATKRRYRAEFVTCVRRSLPLS